MADPRENKGTVGTFSERSFRVNSGDRQEDALLVAGLHDMTVEELASIVCFNEKRTRMWLLLTIFLLLPASSDSFSYAYIGGGFLSRKPNPYDIDVILQTALPYGPEAFEAISMFFVTGLRQIIEVYGVHLHFWMENAPPGIVDFRTFFQYERSDLPEHDPAKGVARIDLREPGNIARLHFYADSEQD